MIYTNPVRGYIHPLTWKRPAGNDDYKVTQRFGCTGYSKEPPFGSCKHYHSAIDISNGKCGGAVIAAAAGVVHFAGWTLGHLIIVINHGGGNGTFYDHLATKLVKKGEHVRAGQVIGSIGKTGATACHLHFGVGEGLDFTKNVFEQIAKRVDPWPRLQQNVTIRPKGPGINIRFTAGSGTTPGDIYATTQDNGTIKRRSDGKVLGLTATMRPYGGIVNGAKIPGNESGEWAQILIDDVWRSIAANLAVTSVS